MQKTLVIILGETRAHELTFENIKINLLDELDADLAICIGIKPAQYDYNNPFYKLAKYRFLYEEPDDNNYASAFDYAVEQIQKQDDFPSFETIQNNNTIYAKLDAKNEDIDFLYKTADTSLKDETIEELLQTYDEVVHHSPTFPGEDYAGTLYGVKSNHTNHIVPQVGVTTYKKHLNWRNFLHLQDQFLGGVKDPSYPQHPGSAGILIYLRWFLLKNLREHPDDILNKYDRFIISRSDYIYTLPHPKLHLLSEDNIWIPDAESYEGFTDRHVVLTRNFVEPYLNILETMITKSNEYFMKMSHYHNYQNFIFHWNLERLIYFHLREHGLLPLVKEFPYVMYTVRPINGSSSWTYGMGEFSQEHNCYIKYRGEYERSKIYKELFSQFSLLKRENRDINIDTFCKFLIGSF